MGSGRKQENRDETSRPDFDPKGPISKKKEKQTTKKQSLSKVTHKGPN